MLDLDTQKVINISKIFKSKLVVELSDHMLNKPIIVVCDKNIIHIY